jgi:hypothetical protein
MTKGLSHGIVSSQSLAISCPLRTEVYFCHQNQNEKYIGDFTTLLKPHNIGTHLKGIETSFQVVALFLKSFHFWASYITFFYFLKIPSVFEGLIMVKLISSTLRQVIRPTGSL